MELKDIKTFNVLQAKNPSLATQVNQIYMLTLETINGISGCHKNFTMHDMNHGLRVAKYMEELAFGIDDQEFNVNIAKFSDLELTLMLLSAILHDIGMFIRKEDREDIKNGNIKYTNELTYSGVLKVKNNDEEEAIKEVIRVTHARRITEFIDYKFDNQTISSILLLNNMYPYGENIARICQAHGEDYNYIKSLRHSSTLGSDTYNEQFIATILRIADYLDLDKQRTPILWYTANDINGFSKEEWEKHFIIHNDIKLKRYFDGRLQIYFDGKSSNAKIHRRYLAYIANIEKELENADLLLNNPDNEEKYRLRIRTKVEDNVQTEGFQCSDLRLNLDYSSITDLLMGKNIYGDSKLGLRELIQNAIDACQLMNEIKENDPDNLIHPAIYITYSKNNKTVKIKDTGIGMTLEIVKKHFLNVGKSYYKSSKYLYQNHNYKPIGQYGIGFLSCFLLSDTVTVKTKHYKSHEIHQIELEKHSEYVVTSTKDTSNFFGTEITLDYDSFFNIFKDERELTTFLELYFDSPIPINIRNEDNDKSITTITNSSKQKIISIMENDHYKYSTINCNNYSNLLNGELHIKFKPKKQKILIKSINETPCYLYDIEEKKFQKLPLNSKINDGYYRKIQYAMISKEDYTNILKSNHKAARISKEIIALAKTKNANINLLISLPIDFKLQYKNDNEYSFFINGDDLKEIIERSGLVYYFEIFFSHNLDDNIFITKNKYLVLNYCFVGDMSRYYYTPSIKYDRFFFYNKGILIEKFRGVGCEIPYNIDEVIGCINYIGNEIKLDVSRNTIINGYQNLQKEFLIILLNYFKESTTNAEYRKFFDNMIEHTQKFKDYTI